MNEELDVQMAIRMSGELQAECAKCAEEAGQTLAEWIRRAMKEKLARETSRTPEQLTREKVLKMLDDSLPAYIEKYLCKKEEEKK